MRILQICQKPPLPANDGGCLASYELSKNLLSTASTLKILSLATEKHPFLPELIDADFLASTNMAPLKIKTAFNFKNVFFNLFRSESIQQHRFYNLTTADAIKRNVISENYDFVIFDGLMSAFYLRDVKAVTKAKLIYRSHNIEADILEQRAQNYSGHLRRSYLKMQSRRLRIFETGIWKEADQIWSISKKDSEDIRSSIGDRNSIKSLPFSLEKSVNKFEEEKHTIFHLASMDWHPNLNGLIWFLQNVWPDVAKEHKNAQLHLGGRHILKYSQSLTGPNVYIHENVENADEFYERYEIMVVPVMQASGVRVKIIQALAKSKVIISTIQGASGIEGLNGEHFLLSGSAKEMSENLSKVLSDVGLSEKLKSGAGRLFEKQYRSREVCDKMKSYLNQPG